MNNDERLVLMKELADHITAQVITGLKESTRCCLHCVFWQNKEETCRNTVNCPQMPQRPPADVIAFGCKLFIPDMIV